MDILYLLIPLSALLVLAIIGVFGWALYRGQFDDLDEEGERILRDDASAGVDAAAPVRASDATHADGGPRRAAPAAAVAALRVPYERSGRIDVNQASIPAPVEESTSRPSARAEESSSRGEV